MSKKELITIETIDKMLIDKGLEHNQLLTTTRDRYITELSILEKLTEAIKESESVYTEKKYKADSMNLYINPAIKEYGTHTTIANNTALALTRMIKSISEIKKEKVTHDKKNSPLYQMLHDEDDYDDDM